MKSKRKTSIRIAVIVLAGGICFGAFVTKPTNVAANEIQLSPTEIDDNYEYPVNQNGETYGLDWNGDNYEDNAPDLIAATGKNKLSGYVRRTDLMDEGDFVKTREEALEYQKNKEKNLKGTTRIIPVYEADGITKIDEFIIEY